MSNTTLLLIAIGAIMLAALPVAAMMKDFLPGMLERTAGLDQLENRIYVLHSEAQEMQDRASGASARRNQQSSEKHRLETDIRRMEKAISDLAEQPPLFVHEVGEPAAGTSKYTVNVSREAAATAARNNGERAQANPIWRYNNVAEVWASSFEEAKQLVETAFPFKLGYQKSFQKGGGTAAEKMIAEAQARAVAEAKAAQE